MSIVFELFPGSGAVTVKKFIEMSLLFEFLRGKIQ